MDKLRLADDDLNAIYDNGWDHLVAKLNAPEKERLKFLIQGKKASGAASTLANHRWTGGGDVKQAESTQPLPPILGGPQDPEAAAIAQRNLRNKGATGLLTTRQQEGPGISRPATLEEAGGNPLKQAGMNLGTSAEAAVQGVAALPYQAVRHPLDTIKGLVGYFKDVYKATGKAGLYAFITREHPDMIPYLYSKGITPTKFVEMVGKDPVNTIGALLAPLALPKAAKGARNLAANVADRAFPGLGEATTFPQGPGPREPIPIAPTDALGLDPRTFTPIVHHNEPPLTQGVRGQVAPLPEQPPSPPTPLVDAAGNPITTQGQPRIALTPPLDTATALFDQYGNRPSTDIPFKDIGKMPVEDFLARVEPQWRARYGNYGDVGFEGPGERYLRDLHEASVAANQPAAKVRNIKRDYIITPAEEKAAANLRTKLSSVTLNSGVDPSVLLDMAVKAAKRNGTDFGRWSMDLADLARKAGVQLTPEKLDELWHAKDFRELAKTPPPAWQAQQVEFKGTQHGGKKPIDLYNLTQDITDDSGKVLHSAGSTVSAGTLEKYGINPRPLPVDPPTPTTIRDHVIDYLANNMGEAGKSNLVGTTSIVNSVVDNVVGALRATRPQLYHLAKQAPDLFASTWRAISAKEDVSTATRQLVNDGLYKILTTPDQQQRFGRWLRDDNIRGVMSDPKRAGSVNPTQLLSAQERAAIQADPVMQSAKQYYLSKVLPKIEAWKKDAGIDSTISTPEGMYARLINVDPQGGPQGRVKYPLKRNKQAQSAKQRVGSETYSEDPLQIIEGTLRDRLPAARHNQLNRIVERYEVTDKDARTVDFAGKEVPVVNLETMSYPTKEGGRNTIGRIRVPEPVARAYKQAINPEKGLEPHLGAWNGLNRAATSLMLASPAEAIMHSLNVIGAALTTEGIGKGTAFGKVARWEPVIGRTISIMADVFNLHGPQLEADVRALAQHGAVRTSQFGGHEGFLQRGKYNPLAILKRGVFDYPGNKRGFKGFETRVRVAAYRALKSLDPTLTDADAARLINNQFGTYVQDLQPALVRALRQVPVLGDPFAAAGVALTKAGFKGLAGVGARGFSPEIAWSVYGSLIIAPLVLNKLLDPQHRWPWEIPGLKYGDIRVYSDANKTIDVPMRIYAPAVARGLNVLGTRQQLTRIMQGDADPSSLAGDFVVGALNTGLHRIGPFGRFAVTAATGGATHLTPQGEQMRLTDKSARSQVMLNLKKAASNMFFVSEQAADVSDPGKPHPSSLWGQHVLQVLNAIGADPTIKGPESTIKGASVRGRNARARDVAYDIASKALNIEDPQERASYIKDRVARDLPDNIQGKLAYKEIYKLLGGSIQRSRAKSAAMAGQER